MYNAVKCMSINRKYRSICGECNATWVMCWNLFYSIPIHWIVFYSILVYSFPFHVVYCILFCDFSLLFFFPYCVLDYCSVICHVLFYIGLLNSGSILSKSFSLNWIRNRNRYLGISRAPLKSQAHKGTSLFTSAALERSTCSMLP